LICLSRNEKTSRLTNERLPGSLRYIAGSPPEEASEEWRARKSCVASYCAKVEEKQFFSPGSLCENSDVAKLEWRVALVVGS
jgi:hypothetical protein